MSSDVKLGQLRARAYRVPTDLPEGDGTLTWDSTTLVLVEIEGGGSVGLGYTYADRTIVPLIREKLAAEIEGRDAFDIPVAVQAMHKTIRNLGRSGLVATAISAIDVALWDLKAKLLGVSLAALLGEYRPSVAIYGSGGFTTYSDTQLRDQLGGWVERDRCQWVKMKIGADPTYDPYRIEVARGAIGDHLLFVDANGAYAAKQALVLADFLSRERVAWFEEPVSSDDLSGLALLRQRMPGGIDIAAGEYGYTLDDFRRLLEAEAVDCLQADATRCGGITGFLSVNALCEAYHIDLSAHCSPALHLHLGCAASRLRHVEWFHDHVRVEHLLFDGAPVPRGGQIAPDRTRPGLGLSFKASDAERYEVR